MVDVEAEHFSLRWNNFHSNLSSGFQALLHEEDLVDVTLAAGGEFVQAHKIVLSVCSPYFKQLFKVNPCKHPIVILKDVSHKDLVDILQFMYRGEVNVRQEDLAAFLKTAELLQVKGLTGQDSPSSPESYVPEQPRPRPAPKSRAVRAPSEKHNKVPQSIPISPTIVEDTPVRAPPYKRMRSEPPPPTPTPAPSSPRPQGESVAGAGSVEYVGLNIPKQEPVDSEVEDMEEKHDAQDDPLLQLLAGDSNHGGPGSGSGSGSGQGMGSLSTPMAGIPSASQDSQDGSQGPPRFVESSRGTRQLVVNGYLYHLNRQQGERIYWSCNEYKRGGCHGRCVTQEGRIVSVARPERHNHERVHDKIRRKELLAQLRRQASFKGDDVVSVASSDSFL